MLFNSTHKNYKKKILFYPLPVLIIIILMVVSILYKICFFILRIIEYNFDEAERPGAYIYINLVDFDVIIISTTKVCTRFLYAVMNLCICSKGIQII